MTSILVVKHDSKLLCKKFIINFMGRMEIKRVELKPILVREFF
jgi:hypothetical protein